MFRRTPPGMSPVPNRKEKNSRAGAKAPARLFFCCGHRGRAGRRGRRPLRENGRPRRRGGACPRPFCRTQAFIGGRFVNRPYGETLICAVGADAPGGPSPRLWTPSVTALAGTSSGPSGHLPLRGEGFAGAGRREGQAPPLRENAGLRRRGCRPRRPVPPALQALPSAALRETAAATSPGGGGKGGRGLRRAAKGRPCGETAGCAALPFSCNSTRGMVYSPRKQIGPGCRRAQTRPAQQGNPGEMRGAAGASHHSRAGPPL